ncbi:hypothetical protein AALG83_06175 [Christensenellaceae bacterium 44-20]
MSKEELLELIARLEQERLELARRAENAEKREKAWYDLWRENRAADKV